MESYNRVVFGLLKASGLTFVHKEYKPSSLQIPLISFSLMCSQIHSQINAVFLSRLHLIHAMPRQEVHATVWQGQANLKQPIAH